jgi:hypothetical protein
VIVSAEAADMGVPGLAPRLWRAAVLRKCAGQREDPGQETENDEHCAKHSRGQEVGSAAVLDPQPLGPSLSSVRELRREREPDAPHDHGRDRPDESEELRFSHDRTVASRDRFVAMFPRVRCFALMVAHP